MENTKKTRIEKSRPWLLLLTVVVALGCGGSQPQPQPTKPAAPATPPAQPALSGPKPELMETAKAVVVTVEILYGAQVPTVAQALTQIERRSAPDDRVGRTFAILDADGWATPDGRLHLQMHVSSEKPGTGSLVYKPTGEVLWNCQIIGPAAPTDRKLTILFDDGTGKTQTVDGSANPASLLDATLKESGMPIKQAWPDGSDRELTFIYSACGCPVKVMTRREGDRTFRTTSKRLDGSERTKDLPVMFPDDPAAVGVINRLMRW